MRIFSWLLAMVLLASGLTLVQAHADQGATTHSGCVVFVSSAGAAGVDYSWYRPSDRQLGGLAFAGRYVLPTSFRSGKALTRAEVAHLHSRGISVLLTFEWSSVGAAGGYPSGVRDGLRVRQALLELGAPGGPPVYFAVDFDATYLLSPVLDYLRGAAAILGRSRVGVYGGYAAVRAALDAGYPYAWQTYAWSRGRWDPRAQVRQVANGALWAGQGDADVALRPFGGWLVGTIDSRGSGGVPQRAHNPQVGRSNRPRATIYRVRRGDTLWSIARRHGLRSDVGHLDQLARRNGIRNPARIYVGQLVRL